jgi:hypothetical protein
MKLTVKTLKGGKFDVDVDDGHTVLQVKGAIVSRRVVAWSTKKRYQSAASP